MRQHVYTLITAALDPTIGYVRMLDTFGNRTVEIFVLEAADEMTAAIQGDGIPEVTTLDNYVYNTGPVYMGGPGGLAAGMAAQMYAPKERRK